MALGPADSTQATADIDLAVDIVDVGFHGVPADAKAAGNRLIVGTADQQPENLAFARGEFVEQTFRAASGRFRPALQTGCKRLARRPELSTGNFTDRVEQVFRGVIGEKNPLHTAFEQPDLDFRIMFEVIKQAAGLATAVQRKDL